MGTFTRIRTALETTCFGIRRHYDSEVRINDAHTLLHSTSLKTNLHLSALHGFKLTEGLFGAGAILYDARQLFDSHNAKADELLRNVASALPDAVATCLLAAGDELNPIRQAALMKVRISNDALGRSVLSIFIFADSFGRMYHAMIMQVN